VEVKRVKWILLEGIRRVARIPWFGVKLERVGRVLFLASRTGLGGPDVNGEDVLVRRLLGSHDPSEPFVFFDVGANVGDRTAFVLSCAVGEVRVHAFEPTPATLDHLTTRFAADSPVRVVGAALSDASGSAALRDYGALSGVNSLVVEKFHSGPTEVHSVRVIAGDEYCQEHGIDQIDFLKIDVEGFEWNVIQGLIRMFTEKRIRAVQFEYGFIHATTGHLMRDFYRLFESLGYQVGPVRPSGPEFRGLHVEDNNFDSGPNFVAALPEVARAIMSGR
jgi:FkbM family methyltransferase